MANKIQLDDTRLDRIESKIDKLSDAIIQIARAEEKIAAIEQRFDHSEEDRILISTRVDQLHYKLDNMDESIRTNGITINIINKLFWVVLIAVVGALSTHFVT